MLPGRPPIATRLGEWVLRAADGVTQRANSVWPRGTAAEPLDALREAMQWYRKRRLAADLPDDGHARQRRAECLSWMRKALPGSRKP